MCVIFGISNVYASIIALLEVRICLVQSRKLSLNNTSLNAIIITFMRQVHFEILVQCHLDAVVLFILISIGFSKQHACRQNVSKHFVCSEMTNVRGRICLFNSLPTNSQWTICKYCYVIQMEAANQLTLRVERLIIIVLKWSHFDVCTNVTPHR